MNVGQVIDCVTEWVELYGRHTPGFCGAHLMGGITTLPKDAEFPTYRDVDVNMVLHDLEQREIQDFAYKGLIMECGLFSLEEYRSLADVLASPELAPNLVVDSLLADPTGMLARLHQAVAQEYPRSEWVSARCEYMKRGVVQALNDMQQARSPAEGLVHLVRLVFDIAGLIAVAQLQPPTHRRCLILMRELLAPQEELVLYEAVLRLVGGAHLTRQQVESSLEDCASAFDHAVAVYRTPIPYGFKLHAHVRPYLVDGAQEMIAAGNHREAMLWIMGFSYIANTAIQQDAPAHERARFQAQFERLLHELGLDTLPAWHARLGQSRSLADAIFTVADANVANHPAIRP
jgi:hypothetical protein